MEYITYDEFKEEVGKLDCKVEKDCAGVAWVETLDGLTVSRIGNERYSIRVYEDVPAVAELSIRLAITPLDERGDRYYLRLKSPIISETINYLNYYISGGYYIIDNKNDPDDYQTIFTKEEIDELNEKYNVLDSFRMEEVK